LPERGAHVTYRDDHDAAIARAEALQVELERSEAERDRLRAQVDRLEHGPSPMSIVAVSPAKAPMTAGEVTALVAEVKIASKRARDASLFGNSLALAVFVIMTAVGAFTAPVYAAVGGIGIIAGLIGLVSRRDPADVIAAIRDAPEYITAIRESPKRTSVIVRTATGSAWLRTDTPDNLLVKLARRCPNAKLR
jgi:hypothetical protein